MKTKTIGFLSVLALVAATPALAQAQGYSAGDVPALEVREDTRIEINPILIRERLRTQTDEPETSSDALEEARLKLLNSRATSTGRPDTRVIPAEGVPFRTEMQIERSDGSAEIRSEAQFRIMMASTSEQRGEIILERNREVFQIRKNALVRQLTVSIGNLKQIRERIVSRIEKVEDSGADISTANTLLTEADIDIKTAEDAIAILADIELDTEIETATSTEPHLLRPRELGAEAIEAVKVAQASLVDVVRAITQALGN